MGKLIDLPQRTRPRKVNNVMRAFLNQALSENDELTIREAHNLLSQQWPTLQVSLPTIKQICQKLGCVFKEQSTWCKCMSGEVYQKGELQTSSSLLEL